jgi:hypothetical protein
VGLAAQSALGPLAAGLVHRHLASDVGAGAFGATRFPYGAPSMPPSFSPRRAVGAPSDVGSLGPER